MEMNTHKEKKIIPLNTYFGIHTLYAPLRQSDTYNLSTQIYSNLGYMITFIIICNQSSDLQEYNHSQRN